MTPVLRDPVRQATTAACAPTARATASRALRGQTARCRWAATARSTALTAVCASTAAASATPATTAPIAPTRSSART
eukprot:2634160-Prymnesium_polylepis.2